MESLAVSISRSSIAVTELEARSMLTRETVHPRLAPLSECERRHLNASYARNWVMGT